MPGTKQGGITLMKTLKDKYGVTEDGKSAFHQKIGKQGGKISRKGGFYANRTLASTAGAKGGSISRRGPA